MKEVLLLGIDVGTQGTKAAVYSPSGRVYGEAFLPSHLIYGPGGRITQDPDEIYASVLSAISEAAGGCEPAQIAAIGVDAQMAGILGIGRGFQAVTPYDSWLDTRCAGEIQQMKTAAEEEIIRSSGCPVLCAHGPKILQLRAESPELYRRVEKFVVLSAYLSGRLAGLDTEDAYLDYTQLHFSGFGDIERLTWSDDLLAEFQVGRDKLPEITAPQTVIGRLSAEAARQCGLISGIPVVAGCGDQAATALGAGITHPGQAFDVAGTASVFSCCTDVYRPDVKHRTLLYARSVIDGLWTPLAYISGGGLCLKWYAEEVSGVSLPDLDSEAETVPPGTDGLVFFPHFSGRTCPDDSSVQGGWHGLRFSHSRAHLYRAILESVGYEYKIYKGCLDGGGAGIQEVRVTGGGAKSRVFNQIKSDILGLPYTPVQNCGSASFGSALTAGFAVGAVGDLARAAQDAATPAGTIRPDPERHQSYQTFAQNYQTIIERRNLI